MTGPSTSPSATGQEGQKPTPHIDGIADTGDGYSLMKDGRRWDIRCIWCDWTHYGNHTKTDAVERYDQHEAESLAAEGR